MGSIIREDRLNDPESLEAEKITAIQIMAGSQLTMTRLNFRTLPEFEKYHHRFLGFA